MLSVTLAQSLKEAGLAWTPSVRDFFAMPDRGLDEHVFVINPMTVGIRTMRGEQIAAFYGSSEQPLDYVPLSEAVWLPREDQLRELLEAQLISEAQPWPHLTSTTDGYTCRIYLGGAAIDFDGFGVDDVYGQALLHVLTR